MVFITPNSCLFNKSAAKLREYLFVNRYVREIIDFGSKKVFSNASVYCCITIISKQHSDSFIHNQNKINYTTMTTPNYLINQIPDDATKTKLKLLCKISNGIATLRDKIYIHSQKLFDEPCWKLITDGKTQRYVLFPYNAGVLIPEAQFKADNPNSYAYLEENKQELALRDCGNKTYAAWYAFGRTQALHVSTKSIVIYVQTLVDPANITASVCAPCVHHNCLCIEPNDGVNVHELLTLIKNSGNVLAAVSAKRANGWITLSSRNLYELSM